MMSSIKLIRYLIIICTALFFARLVFEATPYADLYIVAGLGMTYELLVSNLLYFIFDWVFLGMLAISLVTALGLAMRGPRPSRIAAVWLFGVAIVILLLLYHPLHEPVVRQMAHAFRFHE
jgi:hypothetical protein